MRKPIPFALLVALLAPPSARAGGYFVTNLNPRDLGMVGSLVAAQDSAAAVVQNPSALARLEGLNLSLADTVFDLRESWTGNVEPFFPGQKGSAYPKAAFPPTLAASYSGRIQDRGFGIGAGLNVIGGSNIFFPADWPGNFAIQSADRRVYGIFLVGGLELVKQVRLGGGFVYYRTTEKLEEVIAQNTASLEDAGGALSYDVSAEFGPFVVPFVGGPLVLGLDYKHQAVQKLTGQAHFESPPPPLAPFLLDQGLTHYLTIPNRFIVGAAYRPVQPLLVTFSWNLDRWIVYNSDTFIGDLGTTLPVTRNYKNGNVFRLGAEYDLLPQVQIRAGVLRDLSPVHKDVYDPSLPDANSWAFGVGASYRVRPELGIHFAFFYDTRDELTAVLPARLPGIYNSHAAAYSLGVTYHWDGWPLREPGMTHSL